MRLPKAMAVAAGIVAVSLSSTAPVTAEIAADAGASSPPPACLKFEDREPNADGVFNGCTVAYSVVGIDSGDVDTPCITVPAGQRGTFTNNRSVDAVEVVAPC